eukprot:TRINITY_DN4696_c1_g3_i2.p1 TRINITY_DN4696_c1_g3~~TRINITY_DN4696_c1_g3_i2.p1  ORF type:complete len:180 (+),score=20.22 TRINITY_DN4696_c1_g3_i2:615-1154(+)
MVLFAKYEAAAGQKFNLSKRYLFIGKCNHRKTRFISALLDIPIANPPSAYLGAPLFFGSPKFSHFTKLLDAQRAKLSGWKAKALSFAGRLILVKHVLSSIPLHISFSTPFPKKVSLYIEWILSNFLWSAGCLKLNITRSIGKLFASLNFEGRLGIERVCEVNDACMLKLGWSGMTTSSI